LSASAFQIEVGEEFACIVLSGCRIGLQSVTDPADIGDGFWVSGRPPFTLDDEWRRQLGLIVSDRIEKYSNFVITAKGEGTASRLSYRAEHLLWGMAAGVGVPVFDSGDLVMGNLGEIAVFRGGVQVAPGLQRMFPTYGAPTPQVAMDDLRTASHIAASIEQMAEERDKDLAIQPTPFSPLYFQIWSGIAGFQLGIK
jgi:hypothetical protein